jgi:hypothetical protein
MEGGDHFNYTLSVASLIVKKIIADDRADEKSNIDFAPGEAQQIFAGAIAAGEAKRAN